APHLGRAKFNDAIGPDDEAFSVSMSHQSAPCLRSHGRIDKTSTYIEVKRLSMARELSVGEVARRSGVAVSALHFYEAKGLIRSERTSGNQRRYTSDALRRVAIIKVAQEVGISLAEIGEALESLPEGRTPNRADWSLLSRRWREDL